MTSVTTSKKIITKVVEKTSVIKLKQHLFYLCKCLKLSIVNKPSIKVKYSYENEFLYKVKRPILNHNQEYIFFMILC